MKQKLILILDNKQVVMDIVGEPKFKSETSDNLLDLKTENNSELSKVRRFNWLIFQKIYSQDWFFGVKYLRLLPPLAEAP